ncbi:hypothetical protein BGZ76_001678 [Entomortierella beljakovae]|nr:hypothetical protein BGZ76_001678 [Entomortierella beljakovae]
MSMQSYLQWAQAKSTGMEHVSLASFVRNFDLSDQERDNLKKSFEEFQIHHENIFWAQRKVEISRIKLHLSSDSTSNDATIDLQETAVKKSREGYSELRDRTDGTSKIPKTSQSLPPRRSQRGKRQLNEDESVTNQQRTPTSEKKVRFNQGDLDTRAPGSPFDDLSLNGSSSESFRPETLEDSTGEFSVTLDCPQRIVRLVGPGQESSSLSLDHWVFKEQDVSSMLMKNRAVLVKGHETLQTAAKLHILKGGTS